MIKLSIIIPVYNEAPFLRRCLDSVMCKDESVEVIVIDDASTDGSAEICDEYKNIFTIRHLPKNQGVSKARNYGIPLARGKYITFLDSDDEMSPDGIWNMLKVIETANALPVIGDRPVIQFNHSRYYYRTQTTVTKYKNASGNYYYDNLPKLWCMVWNKIYLRSFIDKYWIKFQPHLQYGEDEIFNLICLKNDPTIYCVDEVTVIKHFENQNSLCHTLNKKKILEQAAALEGLFSETNTSAFNELVRSILEEHRNSETYKQILGGPEE